MAYFTPRSSNPSQISGLASAASARNATSFKQQQRVIAVGLEVPFAVFACSVSITYGAGCGTGIKLHDSVGRVLATAFENL